MTPHDIARLRLISQHIDRPAFANPADLVSALGAIQAQDYLASLWAIGLRLAGNATEASIERAIADRTLVRTWPMRGTLHFVSASDARWMLSLLAPRALAGAAGRHRELELDASVFARSEKLIVSALQGGRTLTRDALYRILEDGRISTGGQRGYHILWCLAQRGVICWAAREGKQHTLALLDEWLPSSRPKSRDASLAELALRYFTGHGPATVRDFAWWSGLPLADARAGLDSVASQLDGANVAGETYWMSHAVADRRPTRGIVHLLPGFDEFYLGYQDRGASVAAEFASRIVPGRNGLFLPVIVIDGRIVGTWKRTLGGRSVALTPDPFSDLTATQVRALSRTAARYRRFLGFD